MERDALIPLDISVPFVRAVHAIMEGEREYHTAIGLFIEAENRHGVRVIYEPVTGSRALGLIPRDPDFRPSMAEIIRLNQDLDQLRAHYIDAPYEVELRGDQAHLFPFVSATWFLVGGTDFANDHLIRYSSGMLCSWTQRAWGRELAEWANATNWMPKHRSLWDGGEMTYSTFCYYLYQIIERYEGWMRVVKKVIAMKCERQLAEEGHGCVSG